MKKIDRGGSCAKLFDRRGLIAYSLTISSLRCFETKGSLFTMQKYVVYDAKVCCLRCESDYFTPRKRLVYSLEKASLLLETNFFATKMPHIWIFSKSASAYKLNFAAFQSLEFNFSLNFFSTFEGVYKFIL